ncbi:pantetheine-phosphate adenylyltransferase [Gemmatimonas aurantiaca]|uniref:pantetheine-phosphate adenylyltransferase n=1 Tax=Gemmatimonas aurantiaca TaxID=173480 RepID=UPI00301D06E9
MSSDSPSSGTPVAGTPVAGATDRTPLLALYAGSFDPITRGHEDLIRRTLTFADRLIVAVANNIAKQPLFSVEERIGFVQQVVGDDPRIEVRAFSGLLVDFARETGARVNVRGLRAVSDFEYEFQIALMNRHLRPELETVFMTPSLDTTFISSSMVREVARFHGDVSELVHPVVTAALAEKFPTAPGTDGRGGAA